MKAKIIKIEFSTKINEYTTSTYCRITFNDPYCGNVKRVVKGVAKCNPDDTFNETLGRRIAEGRAKRAMFQRLTDSAWNISYVFTNESTKQTLRANRETEHIQELLNNYYNEQQK